jgi:cytochrome c oxidase assembly factor CtaG/putative copper export protein
VRSRDLTATVPRGDIRRTLLTSVLLAAGALIVVIAMAGNVYALLGDSAPGPLTSYGAALLRLVAEGTGIVCVGSLVFAAFLAPPSARGRLTVEGYAAVRTAGAAALVWASAAAVLVPFDAADSSGQQVSTALRPANLLVMIDAMEEPKAWLCVLAAVSVVAVGCRLALSWRVTVLLLVVAAAALLPRVVVGHASVGDWHDLATDSVVWHVVAASVWTGTLIALLLQLPRDGAHRALVILRYQRLSVLCFVMLAMSGLVDGLIAVRPEGIVTTGYGLVLVLKVFATVLLGVLIALARRRWSDSGTMVFRVLILELLVLAVAIGVSVGLAHLVPPAFLSHPATVMQTVIGYDLTQTPTFTGLVLGWRPDLILGVVALGAITGYGMAVSRLRHRGGTWPQGRTVAWTVGWLVVLVATSSGIGRYSTGAFSLHMITHMALTMCAPAVLVLGGPITLALQTLPRAGPDDAPGVREWLIWLLESRAIRFIAHPAVASIVFAVSFYALYLTGLFGRVMLFHWAHQLMNVLFLLSGYVFYWLVIGVDRPLRTLPYLARLGMLFAVMPFHVLFGVILMNKHTVIAETFYRYLSVPWVPDLLADQRLGGIVSWATGAIPVIVVMLVLLTRWTRDDEHETRRIDRRPVNGDDGDHDAYNVLLARLADRDR